MNPSYQRTAENSLMNEQMKQKTSVHLFERQIGKRQLKLNTKLS